MAAQVPHGAIRAYVMGERCNTQDDLPTNEELDQMQSIVREGIQAGAVGFSSSRTWLHKDKHGVHVPGTFAGSDEMLALGLSMKGLDHGIFEMVSDHLGDDDEWAWIEQFAEETGRPITLVATSAAAFEGNKMYNIAEAARQKGIEVRPQIAGRPTGVLLVCSPISMFSLSHRLSRHLLIYPCTSSLKPSTTQKQRRQS